MSVLLAGVAVSADPAVASPDRPQINESAMEVERGQTASVGFTFPDGANDSVHVSVGSDDVGFLARATLVDADGDGTATVRLDTDVAGSGDPGSYLSASDGDRLRNATQVTAPANPDEPLAPATYPVMVGPPDDPEEKALLVIRADAGTQRDTASDDSTAAESEAGTAFVYEGDRLRLQAGPGQTISGETDLEPGTELILEVESLDPRQLMTTVTRVTSRGTFNATFDVSELPPGTEFTVIVVGNARQLAETTGHVVECSGGCEPATTERAGETVLPTDRIAVASVTKVTESRTARIPVTFGDADALTVSIGGPEANYVVNGTIRDPDGDGRAVVLFHTDSAGFEAPTLSVVNDGDPHVVEANSETSLASLLDPGNYDVAVYTGPNATGSPAATGDVVVYEATAPGTPGETTKSTGGTATTVGESGNATVRGTDESGDRLPGGVGMIAAGGLLAVVGIGVVLGIFRN